jgi:hypothetical protein
LLGLSFLWFSARQGFQIANVNHATFARESTFEFGAQRNRVGNHIRNRIAIRFAANRTSIRTRIRIRVDGP